MNRYRDKKIMIGRNLLRGSRPWAVPKDEKGGAVWRAGGWVLLGGGQSG